MPTLTVEAHAVAGASTAAAAIARMRRRFMPPERLVRSEVAPASSRQTDRPRHVRHVVVQRYVHVHAAAARGEPAPELRQPHHGGLVGTLAAVRPDETSAEQPAAAARADDDPSAAIAELAVVLREVRASDRELHLLPRDRD